MKTPLNYTGNKSRLVEEYNKHFPQNINTFVDLCCGGGSVGMSVNAKKIIFIDNNKMVVGLLEFLHFSEFDNLIKKIELVVNKFNLSYSYKNGYSTYRKGINKDDNNGLKKYNENGYYELRNYYNSIKNKETKNAFLHLYVLVLYSFNNDMRFNKNWEFNLPVGKTDLNKCNILKLKNFIEVSQNKKCEFICGDFRDESIRNILYKADFIYADPPYLLGDAVYNEMSNWNENTEREFIELFQKLDDKGKKFAFSNVISKQDRDNYILQEGVFNRQDWHVINIKYHYRSASYNKINRNAKEEEVLIKNYK